MKIRAITCFYHPGTPHERQLVNRVADLARQASRRFQSMGYPVETTRLAGVPFGQVLKSQTLDAALEYAVSMQTKAVQHGFTYVSLGPALASQPETYSWIPAMLAETKIVFLSAQIATPLDGVDLGAVKASGKIICEAAALTGDGFTNLRFAGLANVKPFSPFFPAAYSEGTQPAFSLAIECADLALSIFQKARSLASARKRLLQTLETQAKALTAVAEDISKSFEVEFKGIDFSLSPFPQTWCSLGAALEQLGPSHLGASGSLASVAFLADILDEGRWPRAGLNGLVMPVLEDVTLAERSAHGGLSIKDLLLFSAVSGAGLDTIPLPGDATPEQLSAVLLDVAALSARLGRPMLARLMPIPGKKVGEDIHFNFDYFSDGRVMELPAASLRGPLGGDERFHLTPTRLG